MNAFVRQLAALAVLWTLCELLLPSRRQQMVRLVVSLMMMAALVATLGRFLGSAAQAEWPVFSPARPAAAVNGYQRIALTSLANQVEGFCVRTARKAGYVAQAAVYLRQDGALEQIRLWLAPGQEVPLMDENRLTEAIAQLLSISPQKVQWQPSGEAMP